MLKALEESALDISKLAPMVSSEQLHAIALASSHSYYHFAKDGLPKRSHGDAVPCEGSVE